MLSMFMLYYVSKLMVLCILIATGLIASGVYMEWKNIKTLKLKEITLSTIKGIIFIALNIFIFITGLQLLSFCIWAFLTSF